MKNFCKKSIVLSVIICTGLFISIHNVQAFTLTRTTNTGLVAWWTFDGSDMLNGRLTDASGNGNTLQLNNISTSTFYTSGKVGQAGNFDGVDDYATSTDSTSLRPASFTLSAWFNCSHFNDAHTIIAKPLSGPAWTNPYLSWMIRINTATSIEWGLSNGSYNSVSDTVALKTNTWHHVAMTYDGVSVRSRYLDGVFLSSATAVTAPIGYGSRPVLIGADYGLNPADSYAKCKIDDVRIYSRSMNNAGIRQLYHIGVGSKQSITNNNIAQSGLLGRWTFDGKSITNGRIDDVSGNAKHGVPFNISTSTFYTTGKIGQALKFDGINDYVDTATITQPSSLTISFWIKATSTSGIIATWGSEIGCRFGGITSGKINCYTDATDAGSAVSTNILNDNKWHHILFTKITSGFGKLYVDGVLDVPNASESYTSGATAKITLGQGSTYLQGSIDDFYVYNRVVSSDEIKELYIIGVGSKQAVTPENPLKNGIIGWWTFDGKSTSNGYFYDSTPGSIFTDMIAFNISTSTFYTTGKIGQALKFDGIDDYLFYRADDIMGISNLTISAWIKPTTTGISNGYGSIVSADSGANFHLGSNGSIAFVYDIGSTAFSSNNVISANKWSFVTVTVSSGITNLYVNGILSGTANQDIGSPLSGNDMEIGANAMGSNFNGSIDDVRIFNKILTNTQIRQLYNMGK